MPKREKRAFQLMPISLNCMKLSVRSWNCLRSAGYKTATDVAAASDEDLLRIKNFGAKCLKEVRDELLRGEDTRFWSKRYAEVASVCEKAQLKPEQTAMILGELLPKYPS